MILSVNLEIVLFGKLLLDYFLSAESIIYLFAESTKCDGFPFDDQIPNHKDLTSSRIH